MRRHLRLTRRGFVAAALAGLLPGTRARAEEFNPRVGAIRWDAWYERRDPAIPPQDALAPLRYRGRAPLHCATGSDGTGAPTLSCIGDQAVLDAEIEAAARGGLAFWAFGWYDAASPLRRAWTLYQSSSRKHLIDWCPIVGYGEIGSLTGSVAEMIGRAKGWADLMAAPHFFKVRTSDAARPLLFIFHREAELQASFGTRAALKTGLDRFRDIVAATGAGRPYVVLLDPSADPTRFQESGVDAISNYIAGFKGTPDGTYPELDGQVRAYWDRMLSSRAPVIPIAQVGWDTRPRQDHPMPWEPPPVRRADGRRDYFAIATPAQFADEVLAAVRFVESHPAACPAQIVLLYSWDECDEGGCIMPTRGDPNGAHLKALGDALRPFARP